MAAGVAIAEGSRLSIQIFIKLRIRQLMDAHWAAIEEEWRNACRVLLGQGRTYTGTNAIMNAALKGMKSDIINSVVVAVYPGARIMVSGAFTLNEDAVLKLHNSLSNMTKQQGNDIRKGGDPKTLGVIGSFHKKKTPYLLAFLIAGPNQDAGDLPVPLVYKGSSKSSLRRQKLRGAAKPGLMHINVYRALGNSYKGQAIPTTRNPEVGKHLVEYFMSRLGFQGKGAINGTPFTGGSRYQGQGIMSMIFAVVMVEARTRFPGLIGE